jgi:hypothetical protein
VLSRPRLRDVFHTLLFALACFDILFIVFGGISYTFRAFLVTILKISVSAEALTANYFFLYYACIETAVLDANIVYSIVDQMSTKNLRQKFISLQYWT